MLRRSILQLSSHRSVRRIPRPTTYERPLYYSSGKGRQIPKSAEPSGSANPGSAGEQQPESGSSFPKVVIGGVIVGAGGLVAYQSGYLDQYLRKEEQKGIEAGGVGIGSRDDKDVEMSLINGVESSGSSSEVERFEEKGNAVSDVPSEVPHVNQSRAELKTDMAVVDDKTSITHQEGASAVQEREVPTDSGSSVSSGEQIGGEVSMKESPPVKQPEEKASHDLSEGVKVASQDDAIPERIERREMLPHHENAEKRQEQVSSDEVVPEKSLLDEYNLRDNISTLLNRDNSDKYEESSEEVFVAALEELKDGYMSKDGKLIFDFLQAIHAAEKRQAELEARIYAEEKRALKEKYEKELKDAIAREFMRAEEAAILDKELKRERAKAASAIRTLQEKAEEKLKMELEQKEKEADMRLKKVEEMSKAEMAAAIAKEKAAQIEKIAEANLNINALCMAFFARSEEARQSHSVHKLALGALALEDALSKGLPIQKEIEALHPHLKGTDEDSILELVLSSLPEETRKYGTNTYLQLKQKFNDLKEPLRHFSLIPPGGGGLVAHSVARLASWLRVKECDQSGDGIESVINRVERYLAEGKLAEAADALEAGVNGSHAAAIVGEWAKEARNRAVTEQALTFLQAYVTTVSLA